MSAYVPILPADQSWLAGLVATHDAVRDRLTPLLDVPPLPAERQVSGQATPPTSGERPSWEPHAVEAALAATRDLIVAAIGARCAFLDTAAVDDHRTADGRHATAWLLDEGRARGLALVPVTGLRRSDAHQLAVADAASIDGRGICIRLQLPDVVDLDTHAERTLALLDRLAVVPEATDLLVDLGSVGTMEPLVLALAARAVLAPLRRAAHWRTVALAADAPEHPSRPEWVLWRTLAADAPWLGFGDYAGVGRAPADPEPRTDTAAGAELVVVRTADLADAPPGAMRAERSPEATFARPAERDALALRRAAAVAYHLTATVEGIARATGADRADA